jgi:hypothetical protein
VILNCLPIDKQNVSRRIFNTSLELVIDVPMHWPKDFLRLSKRFLEVGFQAGPNIQYCDFQNQLTVP